MSKIGPGIIVMLCGFAGLVIAYIEKTLYDKGLLVNALATMDVTLAELMTLTIVVWLVVGGIIGFVKA